MCYVFWGSYTKDLDNKKELCTILKRHTVRDTFYSPGPGPRQSACTSGRDLHGWMDAYPVPFTSYKFNKPAHET